MTKATRNTLSRALQLEEDFEAGIFPKGSSQSRHFRLLESRDGLLSFVGFGFDIDGDLEKEIPVFRLTEKGRRAAQEFEVAP